MTYRTGATKRNANSIGSVMPVRNDVSAAEIMMPPIFARFSGRAAPDRDGGGGQAEHLEQVAAGHVAAVGSPAMKRAISPCTTLPVAGSVNSPTSKKNGTFQTWCRPNGISSALDDAVDGRTPCAGSPCTAQWEKLLIAPPIGGQTKLRTAPTHDRRRRR